MKRVLIIRGYCGSGKSSIAKLLAIKHKMIFLEYDDFLWGFNMIEKKPKKEDLILAYDNFRKVLNNFLNKRRNIIIEGPLVQRSKNDPFRLKEIINDCIKS